MINQSVPIVILAGGEGQRMGGVDKCLLPLAEETLLTRLLKILQSQSNTVLLNANGDSARFASYGLPVIPDQSCAGLGPLGGLVATMQYLQKQQALAQNQWLLSVAGDCPFLPDNLLAVLTSHGSGNNSEVIYAHSNGRDHFVIALWSLSLLAPIENFLASGERSVGKFIHSRPYSVVNFPDQGRDPFFNINTREQLALAQSLLAQSS